MHNAILSDKMFRVSRYNGICPSTFSNFSDGDMHQVLHYHFPTWDHPR